MPIIEEYSLALKWLISFQGLRQAHTEVHWTIQDFGEER
jgi:hypothetical protein